MGCREEGGGVKVILTGRWWDLGERGGVKVIVTGRWWGVV